MTSAAEGGGGFEMLTVADNLTVWLQAVVICLVRILSLPVV